MTVTFLFIFTLPICFCTIYSLLHCLLLDHVAIFNNTVFFKIGTFFETAAVPHSAAIFVNAAMVIGLTPIVGVPLPLISYGGTSMVTLMIGFGILMSINSNRKLLAT